MAPSSYPRLLLLISRMSTDREQNHNSEVIQAMIKASDMADPEIVDGSDVENKERRSELFGISGLRAKYPQLFIVENAKAKPKFIGDFEKVQIMNESGRFNKKGVLGIDDGGGNNTPTHQPIQDTKKKQNAPSPSEGGGCCVVM